jgi:hypothetical protein
MKITDLGDLLVLGSGEDRLRQPDDPQRRHDDADDDKAFHLLFLRQVTWPIARHALAASCRERRNGVNVPKIRIAKA